MQMETHRCGREKLPWLMASALTVICGGLGCNALVEQPLCHSDINCLEDQVCDTNTRTCVSRAAVDGGVSAEDAGQSDAMAADGAVHDVAPVDSAHADGAVPDGAMPDGAMPDGAMPDGAMPDGAMPDTLMPDSASIDIGSCQPPADWWDLSFTFRQRVTFDNSGQGQALDQFPVLVVLSTAGFDYAAAQADGSDLRFVDEDGSTLLSHQIESWLPGGDSFVWVEVPSIAASSSSDFIWMYYGNSGAPDVQDPGGTFSNGYLAVLHMNETAGPIVSSTPTSFSCSLEGGGSGDPDTTGQIDGANQLDGVDDYFDCGTGLFPDLTHHTISAWVNLDLSGAADHYDILSSERTTRFSDYEGISLYVQRSSGAVGRWIRNSYDYTSLQVTEGAWTFIAIRGFRDGSSGYLDVSVNGSAWEQLDSGNTDYLEYFSSSPLVIGNWPGSFTNLHTKGVLDEVRVASVARSEEWIRAQYLSGSGAFSSLGVAEPRCP